MTKKKKYYVIWEGNETGIYDNWRECQRHIKGYGSAKYKSFPTLQAAEQAYAGSYFDVIGSSKKKKSTKPNLSDQAIIWESIAVDAACSGNPGLMEYQGVYTKTGERLFHLGPLRQGTNNVGEFLALVHGLAYLQQKKIDLPIYTDSRIAMGWIKAKKCRTKVPKTKANEAIFTLIRRAEQWLKSNTFTTEIIKWETKSWGEIPADFGRK